VSSGASFMASILAVVPQISAPVAGTRSMWDAVLGLRGLSTSASDVEFRFAYPIPAWAWIGIGAACFAIAGWSYFRLLGSRSARVALAGVRGSLLLLLAILIAQPQLVKQNERVEKDWVVVMADRSSSMQIADATGSNGVTISRDAQLADLLRVNSDTLAGLRASRNVMTVGFSTGITDLSFAEDADGLRLGEPDGQRTLLGQSIEQAMKRLAARPVAGIVLLSDGRSPDQPNGALLRQLEARGVPVFAVPLGSPKAPSDVAISRIEAPPGAFVGDYVPVSARVQLLTAPKGVGSENISTDKQSGAGEERTATVELVNQTTGEIVQSKEVTLKAGAEPTGVVLLTTPQGAGTITLEVRVRTAGDLSETNNSGIVSVGVVDRPIRVLYIDGYPRWEYRYIKNLLVRERSVTSAVMLLHPNRKYIQDGTQVLDYVPRTDDDWRQFDVVVLGDVLPSVFTPEQLTQLKNLVAGRGGGLLWVGGQGATPGAWRGTPLADLIPFAIQPSESMSNGVPEYLAPVLMAAAPAAERYGVLRLNGRESEGESWPSELTDETLRWPLLRWAQRIDAEMLKPTAEVLAVARPSAEGSASASQSETPLVLSMRYGAGRVVYVATDETWRYRYLRGETLSERFWVPLIRLLGRDSLGRSGKPVVVTANPQQVQVGQQVNITARLLDQSFIEAKPATLTVRVERAGQSAGRGIDVTLTPGGDSGGSDGQTAGMLTFSGTWIAPVPGEFTVVGSDALLAGTDSDARFTAVAADDELRFPQSDHAALAALCEQTGGRLISPDEFGQLPTLLPNRELRTLGTPDIETLWDKPVVWILFITLLATEWIWRRLIKLA
jgi:hypothetical protein